MIRCQSKKWRYSCTALASVGALALLAGLLASIPASADEGNSTNPDNTLVKNSTSGDLGSTGVKNQAKNGDFGPSSSDVNAKSTAGKKQTQASESGSDSGSRISSQGDSASATGVCAGVTAVASGQGWCVADQPGVGLVGHVSGKEGLISTNYGDGPTGYMKRIVAISVDQPITLASSDRFALGYMDQLVQVTGLENIGVSELNTLSEAFARDSKLATISGMDNWKTGNVVDMSKVFVDDVSINSLNLSSWNTGKVTTMSCMFLGVHASGAVNLSGWDTRNVADMGDMFAYGQFSGALNLSGWGEYMNPAVNMYQMFVYSTVNGALDLSNWNFSGKNVTQIADGGLQGVSSLTLGSKTYLDSAQLANMPGTWHQVTPLKQYMTKNINDLFDSSKASRTENVTYEKAAAMVSFEYIDADTGRAISPGIIAVQGLPAYKFSKQGVIDANAAENSFTVTPGEGWEFVGCISNPSTDVLDKCSGAELSGRVGSTDRVITVSMKHKAAATDDSGKSTDSAKSTDSSKASTSGKSAASGKATDSHKANGTSKSEASSAKTGTNQQVQTQSGSANDGNNIRFRVFSPMSVSIAAPANGIAAGRHSMRMSSSAANTQEGMATPSDLAVDSHDVKGGSKNEGSNGSNHCAAWVTVGNDSVISDFSADPDIARGRIEPIYSPCSSEKTVAVDSASAINRSMAPLSYLLLLVVVIAAALETTYVIYRRNRNPAVSDFGKANDINVHHRSSPIQR